MEGLALGFGVQGSVVLFWGVGGLRFQSSVNLAVGRKALVKSRGNRTETHSSINSSFLSHSGFGI